MWNRYLTLENYDIAVNADGAIGSYIEYKGKSTDRALAQVDSKTRRNTTHVLDRSLEAGTFQ